MNLIVKVRDAEVPEALVKDIESRLRFVLGRFGRSLAHVTVRFANVGGPRGRVEAFCQVEARVWGRLPIAAEARSTDLRTAAERAVDRIGRTVERTLAGRYQSPRDFPFPPTS